MIDVSAKAAEETERAPDVATLLRGSSACSSLTYADRLGRYRPRTG